MKTYPIIFSAPMIRALLDGRKTQTRRLITSQWSNLKMHHEMGTPCALWVREAFLTKIKPEEATDRKGIAWYMADDNDQNDFRWKPSIHMPRWASRLTLEVTDVRLQRLQEISREDAIAEVCTGGEGPGYDFAQHAYQLLWESLHGGGSWADNPEVFAISFRVHQQNVDQFTGQRA